MSSSFVLVHFNIKKGNAPERFQTHSSYIDIEDMTSHFNQIFNRVFSRYTGNSDFGGQNKYLGLHGHEIAAWHLFESTPEDMDATEKSDLFLVLYIHSSGASLDQKKLEAVVAENNLPAGKESEFKILVADTELESITDYFGHEARFSMFVTDDSRWFADNPPSTQVPSAVAAIPALWSFYYYGFTTTLRAERHQLTMNLTSSDLVTDSWIQSLLEQRKRIINLKRYFLTMDRSNNAVLKAIAQQLAVRYALGERFERLQGVQNTLEEFYDAYNIHAEAKSNKVTSTALTLLTVVSLPTSILGLVFQSSGIFNDPDALHQNFLNLWVVAVAVLSVVLPFGLAALWNKGPFKKQRRVPGALSERSQVRLAKVKPVQAVDKAA